MAFRATRQIQHGALVNGANTITVYEAGDTVDIAAEEAESLLACGAIEVCEQAPARRGRRAAEPQD